MREVRVESVDGLEMTDDGVRLVANSGELELVFPGEVWKSIGGLTLPLEPSPEELAELLSLKHGLAEHARTNGFATVVEDVPCGGDGESFDLVLRPSGPFALTTGYVFVPVVGREQVARLEACLSGERFVEGIYLVGAVAEEGAFVEEAGDVKVLSVRGRACSSSRFELAPELWRVLSEEMGWRNVELAAPVGFKQ
ncbi:MAG: hypothetical protein AVDCRST_MAG25-3692 [uncultured Rubrobacteraceae bacterium]|uniref:Uncharacterized protein n=1 Tax=uncultured Rubrobacteraceae bacterium TaxID=349277 RepID=A0A6J4SIN7_9ACTN|nr:MAG: hypothetical protein AVDCRST_MAG25-3692 [uncultured Rubrobacteraceae bacterium]